MAISHGLPTYWLTGITKDCINFFLTEDTVSPYIEIENVSDLPNNHSRIILTTSCHLLQKQKNYHLTNKNTNWDQFREEVHNEINLRINLITTAETDKAIFILQSVIFKTAKKSKPVSSNLHPHSTLKK